MEAKNQVTMETPTFRKTTHMSLKHFECLHKVVFQIHQYRALSQKCNDKFCTYALPVMMYWVTTKTRSNSVNKKQWETHNSVRVGSE